MKQLITSILVLASLAAQAQTAPAQTPPTETWTLEECVIYAVENSPETGIQAERNAIAKQAYREAIGRMLPTLSASTDANFRFGRQAGENNVYTDLNSFSNSYGASTGLSIFEGFRTVNSIRLAKINRVTGRHELDRRRDAVAYATMEAFFNVMYYTEMVTLATAQLEENTLNLRQTERMEELGIKGFPDVAEMRAQEAAAAYTLTRQQNQLAIGIILLKEQMNFPIEGKLTIAPFDLAAAVTKSPLTAAGVYSKAVDRLPAALAATSQARAAEMSLRIARGARYPTLTMRANYGTDFYRNLNEPTYTSFREQLVNKRGYGVSATLSIPIFNGFATSTNIARSRHNLNIARIERDDALRSLYTEIEQAVADMNGTADQHVQAMRQRESASVAHNVNQRKYDEGLISALELHTSSNRLVQARADELYSRLTWILKKRMVDYYTGTPLIPNS